MGSQEQKNLVLAIVLSVVILFSFQLLAPPPPPAPESTETSQPAAPGTTGTAGGDLPISESAPTTGADLPAGGIRDRGTVLEETPRVAIATPVLSGSISLDGGRIDDLVLKNYRQTLNPESAQIELLRPLGTANTYFAGFGWTSAQADLALPDTDTRWEAAGARLEPGQPLTLSWDNGQGLRFERVFEVDENYLFTVTRRVINSSGNDIVLSPFSRVQRRGMPEVLGFFILHEGFTGAFNESLEETTYDDLQDDAEGGRAWETWESTGGWLGITDKYWMVALIPEQDQAFEGNYLFDDRSGTEIFQAGYTAEAITIPAGGQTEVTTRVFAGAKVLEIIEGYQEAFALPLFDRSVDFGWFFFLTIPLFHLLSWFFDLLGNFGLAILALTVLIKLAFFPLANKSYRSMAKMRALQPEMVKMRERFGDDRQRLNQEMMELYKREKVNPMAGCLPILIQIPVFFALYKVLFVTIEMRHAPFYGWVQDLSAPDPTSILNGFGLLPWGIPDLGFFAFFSIGVWPLLMGLTMFLQTKLNPQPADPVQAKIFTWMPIFFMFLLAQFPAGLVIYWTWNNVLSILQQYVIMRRAGVPIGGTAPPIQLPGMKPAQPAEEAEPEAAAPEKEAPARAAKANGGTTRSAQKKKRRGKKKREARAENGAASSDSTRRSRRSGSRDGKPGQADRPDGD